MLTAFLALLRDFVYPPLCPLCETAVLRRGDWCEPCLARAMDVRRLTPDALLAAPRFDEAWALGRYREALRPLLMPLKYHEQTGALPYLATFLGRAFDQLPPSVWREAVAVPIPLHRDRADERGFNQTTLIFRDFLASRAVPWREALARVKATAPQSRLQSPRDRLRNVAGAFALAGHADVAGRRVLLLDDIYTTGATMDEASRTLLRHGAVAVVALALASDH